MRRIDLLETGSTLLRHARLLLGEGRYAQCVCVVTRAFSISNPGPNRYLLLLIRAISHSRMGHFRLAVKDYSCILKLPTTPLKKWKAYQRRALNYLFCRKNLKAIDDASMALRINEMDSTSLCTRARALYHEGAFEQALIDYNLALKIHSTTPTIDDKTTTSNSIEFECLSPPSTPPTPPPVAPPLERGCGHRVVLWARGVTYFALRRFRDALLDFSACSDIVLKGSSFPQQEDASELFYARGLCHYHLSDFEDAILDCNTALEIDPYSLDSYYCRGASHHSSRQYDRAFADFSKVIALTRQGRTFRFRNPKGFKDPKAGSQVRRLSATYFNRGIVLADLQRVKQAIASLKHSIKLLPTFNEACRELGECYGRLRRFEAATMWLTRAIELNEFDVSSYCHRGFVWICRRDYNAAKVDFSEAAGIAEAGFLLPKFALGLIHCFLGEKEESIEIFNDLYALREPGEYDLKQWEVYHPLLFERLVSLLRESSDSIRALDDCESSRHEAVIELKRIAAEATTTSTTQEDDSDSDSDGKSEEGRSEGDEAGGEVDDGGE